MNVFASRTNQTTCPRRTIINVALAVVLLGSVAGNALAQAPANDNFAAATVIASLPFSDAPDDTLATSEPGEPSACYSLTRTIWYSFTPATDVVLKADMAGSSMNDTNLSIYQAAGAGFAGLSEVNCNSFGDAAITFTAQAGTTYYFQAGDIGFDTNGGPVQFNLQEILPPANDNFAAATVITGLPFSDSLDDTAATTETGEPPACYFFARSVWYSFTPAADVVLRADMAGSSIYDTNLGIYQAVGAGFAGLNEVNCASFGGSGVSFTALAGTTYYFQAGDSGTYSNGGPLQFNLQEVLPPPNDDFASAAPIAALPFIDSVDTAAASQETGEPTPSCAIGDGMTGTVWYAFTPAVSGSVSASFPTQPFYTVLAAYTGNSLASLAEIGCSPPYGGALTFHVTAGTTYFFQVAGVFGDSGPLQFQLEVPPMPEAGFYSSPDAPSIFDTVYFYDSSYDPVGAGFRSFTWVFGDGAFGTGDGATHQYAADGDYVVQHTIRTEDGRTATISQSLHVETHDVAIVKRSVPRTAQVGQTRLITVRVRSKLRPEMVQVELFNNVPLTGDFESIGTLTLFVPARRTNRTTPFYFSYTYTAADADAGKVTFEAVATIIGANDALPADNETFATTTRVRPARR